MQSKSISMLKRLAQRSILTHLFFVSLFLVIPTLAFVRPPSESSFALTRVFIQDTIANFVLLCFFYLNYYILLPKFFFTRKYLLYILFVILFLSLALTLPFLAGKFLPFGNQHLPPFDIPQQQNHPPPSAPHSIVSFVFDEFRRHLSLFFSAIFFSFLLRTREHLSKLKEEKLQAELSSLKTQINPHFLFNTLNSIYALTVKKDDKAPDAVIHLAGLMRYIIKDAGDNRIPLQKELDYIDNYIELQKARLGNTATINFSCSGNAANKEIAPLILITYIENAFKYGINPDEDSSVTITITVDNNNLHLKAANNKLRNTDNTISTGIGIQNTKERLKLLYPEKHQLIIEENDKIYSVNLIITLQ